jgi:hypothetical protein
MPSFNGNIPVAPTSNTPLPKNGLYDRLVYGGSSLSQFDGTTPPVTNQDTPQSNLHYEYSINGNPNLQGYPSPSILDLNDPIGSDPNYKPIYTPLNTYKSKILSLNQ